jgi:hypothetical protein
MLAFLAGLVFPLPGATAASPGEPEGSLIAVDYAALIGGADLDFKVPLGPGAERGLPIGNGRVGTLLWTRPEQSKLHMQINHTDVFAFRNSSADTDHSGPIVFIRPALFTIMSGVSNSART